MLTNCSWTILLVAVTLAACGANPGDIDDLKKGQKDIFAKLDNLEKAVQGRAPAAAQRPQIDPNKVYNIPTASLPVRGPKTAKVTIAEFSDFQCPFCAQTTSLVDQVLKAYPKDVNFVYKQFPLAATMHPNALPAAKAAVAAGKQSKFWEMHDLMFQNNRDLTFDKLKEHAGSIGVDVARWEKDFNSPEVEEEIKKDRADGLAVGVTGTPTFFVNGKLVGNRSFDGFKDMIEAALKAQGEKQDG